MGLTQGAMPGREVGLGSGKNGREKPNKKTILAVTDERG